MVIEAGEFKEEESKKKKNSEKENQENKKKGIEHKKMREKILAEIEAEEQIFNLKALVEKGVISKETAEKVIAGNDIDEEIIHEIFKKIDQIEEIKNVDKYLPKELRISHDDYIKALHDDIFRVQMLTKLNSALTLISRKINLDSAMGLNLFSGFLTVLDKNLILVQENIIDVKDNLIEVDEKKFGKKEDKRSLWQKIIDFIKEILKNN